MKRYDYVAAAHKAAETDHIFRDTRFSRAETRKVLRRLVREAVQAAWTIPHHSDVDASAKRIAKELIP